MKNKKWKKRKNDEEEKKSRKKDGNKINSAEAIWLF